MEHRLYTFWVGKNNFMGSSSFHSQTKRSHSITVFPHPFLKPPKIKLFRKVLIKKVKDCFSLLWEQIFWEKLNEKVSRKLLSVEIAKLLNSIFYSNFLLFVPKILFSLETYCNRKFQTTFCYAVQFQWLCEWKMEMWKFKRGKCNFEALNVV